VKNQISILFVLALTTLSGIDSGNSYAQEPVVGEVRMVAFDFAPRYWTLCDGRKFSIQGFYFKELYSVVQTTYGGDGRTTFALPDLRGRVPLHIGKSSHGTDFKLGMKGGVESYPAQMNARIWRANLVPEEARVKVGVVRGSPVTNMQPSLGINYLIAVHGRKPPESMEGMLGEIRILAGSEIPDGWEPCDGKTIRKDDNLPLFRLLGNRYGGDGETSFNLPDLRGRVAMQAGIGTQLSERKLGESGDSEYTKSELVRVAKGDYMEVSNARSENTNDEKTAVVTGNMQPYLAMNFVIRTKGQPPLKQSDNAARPPYEQEGFYGEIRMFTGDFAPRGWAFCDGSVINLTNRTVNLFSLIGVIYGGNGRTTYALPDLRGRVAIHKGSGPGLSKRSLGERTGSESMYQGEPVEAAVPLFNKWPTQLEFTHEKWTTAFSISENKINDAPVYRSDVFYYKNHRDAHLYKSDKVANAWTIRSGMPDKPGEEVLVGKATDEKQEFPWELDWGDSKLAQAGTLLVHKFSEKPPANLQPYATVNYIICIEGLYPSRN